MKILNIHIDNFGKLSDVDIDFSKNPTIIFEDNGWGKSTLATFIKVMLYGFDGESKKKLIDKEREKYRPWNKGIYGGSILLEISGKEYELTRHFGSKEKDDSGSLVDITTKLETKEYEYTKLGEQLFAIDMDAFLRTVYLGQGNIAVHVSSEGIGDSVAAKISNLAEATDDVNNFDIVMKAFKEKMNSLKSGSKFGEINKLNSKKTELEANVRQAEIIDISISEIKKALNDNEIRLSLLIDSKDKLEKEWVAAGELGRYAEWKKNHDALEKDNSKLKEQLMEARLSAKEVEVPVKSFDEEEVKKQLSILDKVEECKEQEKDLTLKIDNLKFRYDTELSMTSKRCQREFEEAMANRNKTIEYEQKILKSKRTTGIIVGAVVLLLAIVLLVLVNPVVGIVLALAGLGAVAFPVISTTSKKKPNEEKIAMQPVETYFVNKNSMEEEIQQLEEQKLKASHDAREYESYIRQFFELMEMDYSIRSARQELISIKDSQKGVLQMQEERKKHLETAQKAYEESCAKLEESEKSQASKAPEFEGDVRDMDAISAERKMVDDEIEQIKNSISAYNGQLNEKRSMRDGITEDEEQLDIIKAYIEEYEHRYDIIQKTADYMNKAKEALNSIYMNPIADAYKKYYGYVADDIEDFDIDANINVTKKELGEKRRADNLSCGYKDMVDIALRMALVDVMYSDEKPFIILDDPFVNLDTDKLNRAKEMLNEMSKEYQVIYFTCHESRA